MPAAAAPTAASTAAAGTTATAATPATPPTASSCASGVPGPPRRSASSGTDAARIANACPLAVTSSSVSRSRQRTACATLSLDANPLARPGKEAVRDTSGGAAPPAGCEEGHGDERVGVTMVGREEGHGDERVEATTAGHSDERVGAMTAGREEDARVRAAAGQRSLSCKTNPGLSRTDSACVSIEAKTPHLFQSRHRLSMRFNRGTDSACFSIEAQTQHAFQSRHFLRRKR
eukprot:366227-Chlamydomonas_euryale.AAC.12